LAFSLHTPLACLGLIALFIHGREKHLGSNLASHLCLITFTTCIVVFTFFCFFSRIHELEVDQRGSVFGPDFILLTVKYHDSNYIPPGSFFNLYASTDSYMSVFHSHSFPVFSTRNSRIVFLIRCRNRKDRKKSSFTSRFYDDNPSCVRVQGPFKGLASSFLLSLNPAANRNIYNSIFLCGWNAGFASVMSLLEYFHHHAPEHYVQSITCLFSNIPDVRDDILLFVERLVKEWAWDIPLTIIESDSIEDLSIVAGIEDKTFLFGMDESNWQELFPHSKIWFAQKKKSDMRLVYNSLTLIVDRVLYVSGADLKYELFREPKWRTFVEAS